MKEKHGEFIYIVWDDNDTDFEYVKGHVSFDEAVKVMNHFHGIDSPKAFGIKHKFARWVPAIRWSDFYAMFYTYDEKRIGTFPVTEIQIKEKTNG